MPEPIWTPDGPSTQLSGRHGFYNAGRGTPIPESFEYENPYEEVIFGRLAELEACEKSIKRIEKTHDLDEHNNLSERIQRLKNKRLTKKQQKQLDSIEKRFKSVKLKLDKLENSTKIFTDKIRKNQVAPSDSYASQDGAVV